MISWRKLESPQNGISIEHHFFSISGLVVPRIPLSTSAIIKVTWKVWHANEMSSHSTWKMKIADIILPFLELPLGIEKEDVPWEEASKKI
jgi:hypothetical protein